MALLKLRASDGEVHEVNADVMSRCSATFREMLEYCTGQDDAAISLPSLTSPILKKVIQWVTYHQDDASSWDSICSWDADFLQMDLDTLYFLLLAADYLEIRGLNDLLCRHVASIIQGKTTEEIREHFGIKSETIDSPTHLEKVPMDSGDDQTK